MTSTLERLVADQKYDQAHCPDCGTAQVVDTAERVKEGPGDWWQITRLACGHDRYDELAWCVEHRRHAVVVDTSDESGNPERSGRCDVYRVRHLDCGHQRAQRVSGASDWVL